MWYKKSVEKMTQKAKPLALPLKAATSIRKSITLDYLKMGFDFDIMAVGFKKEKKCRVKTFL